MNGIWISLDGCGGSGKTTFFERLKQIFPEFVYVPEFSSLCTGTALEKMIKESGPYIIPRSCIGSSLLFLSDYFVLLESMILPSLNNKKIVVSDRGFLSKIALQDIVMSQKYPANEVEAVLTNLFQLSPIPNYSFNFDIPISVLRERLVKRDGIFRQEHEQIIEPTKRRINHYAEVFHLAKKDLRNDQDIEQAVNLIKQITEPF